MNDRTGDLNFQWAYAFADAFSRLGIKNACISPGSRCTPLTLAFTHHPDIQCFSIIDERSAAFFALGQAKVSGIPSILICTSGTATANYFPAVIEACHSNIPMIICTADRPPELHGRGANQTIDQQNLYGNKVRFFSDVGLPKSLSNSTAQIEESIISAYSASLGIPPGPVHLNFPFRKPLEPDTPEHMDGLISQVPDIDVNHQQPSFSTDTKDVSTLSRLIHRKNRGIIFVGPSVFEPATLESIVQMAEASGYPILADGISQLRFFKSENADVFHYNSIFLRSPDLVQTISPEIIIRFGRQPTATIVNDFLYQYASATQILISESGDNDDATNTLDNIITGNISKLCDLLITDIKEKPWPSSRKDYVHIFRNAEEKVVDVLERKFNEMAEISEAKIFQELVPLLPEQSNLFVSNSMPVRDMDWFSPPAPSGIRMYANRGASGIDGILSSAFGVAANSKNPTVLVTGDLAFYHDQNALLTYTRYHIPLTIVLVNNKGGGIFDMLPASGFVTAYEEFIKTAHSLDFKPIVETYGGLFHKVKEWSEFSHAVKLSIDNSALDVIEVQTDAEKSMRFRQEIWAQAVKEIEQTL